MLSDLIYRLRAVFRRKAVEAELDDELRFHLDREVDKRMRAGISREEAGRQARLAFGGIDQTKEHCRQNRGVSLLEGLLQDTGYAFRVLKKSPGFTAAVALSLALGIGANTAIFSLIDAVMWKSLPVKNPESLWALSGGFSYREHQAMQRNNLADLAAYSPVRLNVSVDGSVEPTAEGLMVSGSYFSLLGVNPIAGRAIGPDDDRVPNGHAVAMISHGYWKRRFASSPAVIGRKISLCGTPFTVIGVTPPEFFGLEVGTAPDIFVPVMMQPAVMPSLENLLEQPIIYRTWLRMVGRLRPGVHPLQAASALGAIRDQEIPQAWKKSGKFSQLLTFANRITLAPASTGISDLRRQFSQPLFLLMAVVGVVLLIACANTANLLLARAAARRPEFAVRLALGAGRRRLMRQLLVESVTLAALGGVCGILLARLATQLLVSFLSAGRTPIVLDLSPDLRILAFTAAVSVATGILFGFAPALRATRIDLVPALKNLKASSARSGGGLRPGKILAIAQVALSLMLLVAAGLFVRSLQNLNNQDAGFPRDKVLIVRVEPRGSDQRNIEGTTARLDRIYKELLERVSSMPGVQSASLAHFSPTSVVSFGSTVTLATGEQVRANSHMVYPNYFATVGIPIVAGRDFQSSDLRVNSPHVIVLSEALASQAFPGENALGKLLPIGRNPAEVIGIVRDARYANLRGDPTPLMYQPFLQTRTGRGQMTLHVRIQGDPGVLAPAVRAEVQRIDPNLPMFELRTLADEIDAVLIRERMIALLSSCFGLLALALACIGLYGLLAFGVVQRTGEMGIRVALGARRVDVTWIVLREALVLVLLGVALGIPMAVAIARLTASQISGLLFGLEATDPVTIAAAALVMALVAATAAYLPARRASTVDPMIALRNE